jgi:hypothetical protein
VIDLDGFAIGLREWDLVLTAMYHDGFGWHTRKEYEDFAHVYGYDVRQWPEYPVLCEVREFLTLQTRCSPGKRAGPAGRNRHQHGAGNRLDARSPPAPPLKADDTGADHDAGYFDPLQGLKISRVFVSSRILGISAPARRAPAGRPPRPSP